MIAISYRREDSLPIAGRLYDRLQAKFGRKNVFMDFDSIPPGADFRQHIRQMIECSNVVIAIIGPHWLGEQPDASRRIDNPADFVRLEIAYALEGGIPVIPLLVNTTQMPKPEVLPPDIQELAFRHALPLDSGMDFHSHADRLITGIGKAMAIAPRSGRRREASKPTASVVNTRSQRKIVIWSAAIVLGLTASALLVWYVGTHRREPAKQVATANESNSDKNAQPFSESAPTVKPSVEQSVSPLPLGSQAPKEAALTTAPSPTAVEVRKAKRLESEEKAESSPANTAVQTQRDSRPIYVVTASVSKTVNIRSDHSAGSTIIEKLRPGDRVFLEDGRVRNDDPPHSTTWQKVTTMNGATGWIDFVYLAPEQSSPPRLASEQPKSIVEQSSQPQITLSVGSNVNSVAFSRDGTRIATGSDDATTKVWDAQSGKELLTLSVGSIVNSIAFSPDGTRIATGSADATARVWDAQGGKELLTLKGHSYSVNSVAFSSDGRRILTGSTDDTARVWDAQSGKELLTLSVGSIVTSVAFSRDGTRIATGSYDATARVWDAQSGKELLTLKGHSYSVNSVALSPDDKRIVTGSADDTAKVWDAQGGKELFTLKGHSSSVFSVAFSPDGTRIVTGSLDTTARVWDVHGEKELLKLKGHSSGINSVAFSPDGRRIVTGSTDTTTKVWEFSDRNEKSSAPFESLSPTASPNDTGAQKLTKVFVKKYGFSVLLPTELFPDAATKLADANTDRLVSVNGCFRAAFNVLSGPVKNAYDNCIAEFRKKADHPTIDYKVLKDTWFVVSGDSDTHYYTKGVKRGDNVIVMELGYEGDACNDVADATLTEISRKFDGN
jgi:WD40 repeat protein